MKLSQYLNNIIDSSWIPNFIHYGVTFITAAGECMFGSTVEELIQYIMSIFNDTFYEKKKEPL